MAPGVRFVARFKASPGQGLALRATPTATVWYSDLELGWFVAEALEDELARLARGPR